MSFHRCFTSISLLVSTLALTACGDRPAAPAATPPSSPAGQSAPAAPTPPPAAPPATPAPAAAATLRYLVDGAERVIESVDGVRTTGDQTSISLSAPHASGATLTVKVFQFTGVGTYPIAMRDGAPVATLVLLQVGANGMTTAQAKLDDGEVVVTAYDAAAGTVSGTFSGTVVVGNQSWRITEGRFSNVTLRSMQ